MQAFGLPYIVAVNRFITDTKEEIQAIEDWCLAHDHPAAVNVWEEGGEGGDSTCRRTHDTSLKRRRTAFPICKEEDESIEEKSPSKVAKAA
ncbi:formate--tetrahydrofolate ligase [Bacillus sp. SL00103]